MSVKRVLIQGVGINDSDYKTSISKDGRVVWRCPFYRTWLSMLARIYSSRRHNVRPTYHDCSVVEEWKTFSNFKAWMEQQDWEGKSLDKDLLFRGNKVYSPEKCVFVPQRINAFVIECNASRGDTPIGVSLHKPTGKFTAQTRNPFNGKCEYLGLFLTPDDAHDAWLQRKLELAKLLAVEENDSKVAKAVVDRYLKYKRKE